MKAAVYDQPGPPEVLRYRDVPDPVPGPDEVVVAVAAISIEGGDLMHRRGAIPTATPHVVGYAAAGTIAAVGAEVRDRAVGQRVAAFGLSGSHAERWAVPARQTWAVPDDLPLAEAAVLPVAYGTAHHCLFARGGLQPGETVLINGGAGGVGVAAIQLARNAGATVLTTARRDGREARLRELGAGAVIDYRTDDIAAEAKRHTGGRGVDLVVDPVGATVAASLAALRPEGRLVFVGAAAGKGLTVDLWPAMAANQSLLGVYLGALFGRPEVDATVDAMLADVVAGRLTVPIARTFPLAEAAAAHRFAEEGGPLGRVVMIP